MQHNDEALLADVRRLVKAARKWAKWDARCVAAMNDDTPGGIYIGLMDKRGKWKDRCLSYSHHLLSSAAPDIADRLRLVPDTPAPAPDEAAHKGSCVMVHRALYTQICEERAALTARVAVLEAELAVIEKWASVVEDEEPGSAVSRAFARGYDAARRWVAMWFKNDAAPGKEPTSE